MPFKDDTSWIKTNYFPWSAITGILSENSNTNQYAWMSRITINIVFWSHTFHLNSCLSTVLLKSPDKLGNSWWTITVTPCSVSNSTWLYIKNPSLSSSESLTHHLKMQITPSSKFSFARTCPNLPPFTWIYRLPRSILSTGNYVQKTVRAINLIKK